MKEDISLFLINDLAFVRMISDITLLDNCKQAFLWLDVKCSEVETIFAYKFAHICIQHLRVKRPDKPRTSFLTLTNKELRRFAKCVHGWGAHKRRRE